MKTTLFTISLVAIVFNVSSQKKTDVPANVKSAFTSAYPEAKSASWEMEDAMYEAEWKQYGIETSVLYNASAALVQTETEIPVSELPAKVSDYVKQSLGGKKISEATRIVAATRAITFEAEVGKVDYIFDADGNLLRREAEEEEDDDDDENGEED
ncbi:MAG: PepSY-like domain-containing protein [Flavobacteriales bacterium]|nr:PepSY-like domain-containing protein [Flavobacteriales bacterium]